MGLLTRVDVDRPLPDEMKLYLAKHGSTLLRALINELGDAYASLDRERRENEKLRARLRDNRGLADG